MTPEGRQPGSGINIFIDDDPPITGARIKVIGVGGRGGALPDGAEGQIGGNAGHGGAARERGRTGRSGLEIPQSFWWYFLRRCCMLPRQPAQDVVLNILSGRRAQPQDNRTSASWRR